MLRVMSRAGKPLSNSEIAAMVSIELELSINQMSLIHSGSRTELQYRLAWARTKAKSLGFIVSPARETWQVTPLGTQNI